MKKKKIKELVDDVETYCKERGIRFTPPRKIALEVIAAASPQPIGAYDVIEEIGKITDKPKPTTVYRAIGFLYQHGFIHKIESLNSFIVCHEEHRHEGSQFIICNECGIVGEVNLCHLPQALQKKINDTNFKMEYWNTEIHGICQQCQA